MMGFENPLMLWGASAFAVLIAIYLMRHERLEPLRFGAIRFLIMAHKKTRRKLRFENWLQFLVRALLIALLALVFAKPLWYGGLIERRSGGARGHLYVVDVSLSMLQGPQRQDGSADGKTLFERCRAWIEKDVGQLADNEIAGLVSFAKSPDVIVRPTFMTVRAKREFVGDLKRLEATAASEDLFGLDKQLASLMLSYPQKNWVIHLATDRTRDFSAVDPVHLFRVEGREVRLSFCPTEGFGEDNLGLLKAAVTCYPSESPDYEACRLTASVRNFSDRDNAADLSLIIGSERIGTRSILVRPDAAETFDIQFKWQPRHASDLEKGRVEISAIRHDNFALDNEIPILIEKPQRRMVGLYDGEGDFAYGGKELLSYILNPLPKRSDLFGVRTFNYLDEALQSFGATASGAEPARAEGPVDVLILNGLGHLDEKGAAALKNLLDAAGRENRLVLLSLSSAADPWRYNDLFMQHGFRFLSFKQEPPVKLDLSKLFPYGDRRAYADIHEYFTIQVLDPVAVQETVTFENGLPFLIRTKNLIAFAVTFSGAASNVPFKNVIIPFFYNLIGKHGAATTKERLRVVDNWDLVHEKAGLRKIVEKDGEHVALAFPESELDLRRLPVSAFEGEARSASEGGGPALANVGPGGTERLKTSLIDPVMLVLCLMLIADLLLSVRRGG